MCGIFGYYSFNEAKVDRIRFNESLLSLIHRGPDFQDCQFYNNDKIALGHVRLSIIDLTDSSNQPMQIGKYHIIFNGEIYNYIELRKELIDNGYSFITKSDTEVIVNSYDFWGEECVTRFNGMWAFAILNDTDNSMFCSRDRFGVKPFNYYVDDHNFLFGSEIKPIILYDETLKKPNFNSIALYCTEGKSGEIRETWFNNILRLLPAHNLVIRNGKIKIYRYYNYPNKTINITKEVAEKEFYNLFIDAVKIRMRSDVLVGTTLSGGLDSTSIVAAVRTFSDLPIETFTACFPDFKNDEFVVADKTNSFYSLDGNKCIVEYNSDYLSILKKVIYHLESGNLSPSIMPLWKVYETANQKVKVVLEGQGADELMGGYIQIFAGAFIIDRISDLKFIDALETFNKVRKDYSAFDILLHYFRGLLPDFLKKIWRTYFFKQEGILLGNLKSFENRYLTKTNFKSMFKRTLQYSHQTTLVNLLHYGDAISMAFSIESRLPFMDYRLVDYVFSLPSDFLIAEGKGKFILRESLKNILPDYINSDRRKLGFPSPINEFLTENKDIVKSILLDSRTINRGIFCEKKLLKLIDSDHNGSINSGRYLFRLLSVELWFREFID